MKDTERFIARSSSELEHVNTLVVRQVSIRLFNPLNNPIGGARYRLTLGDHNKEGKADADGWIILMLPYCPERCHLEWDYPERKEMPGSYAFEMDLNLDVTRCDEEEGYARRLHNLGYSKDNTFSENLADFQKHYRDQGLTVSGELDANTKDVLCHVHDNCEPRSFSSRGKGI